MEQALEEAEGWVVEDGRTLEQVDSGGTWEVMEPTKVTREERTVAVPGSVAQGLQEVEQGASGRAQD